MKLIGKGGLSRVVDIMLIVLMAAAPVMMVTLPWTIPLVTGRHPGEELFLYEKYMAVLLASGVVAELVLWQAHGIMRNVNRGRAFCADTVRRLRVLGIECLSLGVAYAAVTFFVTKIFMVVVLLVFVIVGMILLVFSELFRQAVAYKEENDMTI